MYDPDCNAGERRAGLKEAANGRDRARVLHSTLRERRLHARPREDRLGDPPPPTERDCRFYVRWERAVGALTTSEKPCKR